MFLLGLNLGSLTEEQVDGSPRRAGGQCTEPVRQQRGRLRNVTRAEEVAGEREEPIVVLAAAAGCEA